MDSLSAAWRSLGIAFSGVKGDVADPERTLVRSLALFQAERKLLSLALAWAQVYGDLIHIQRINALSRGLPVTELSWLGGLAAHAAASDRRWLVVVKTVRKRLGPGIQRLQSSDLDRLVAERKGRDEHFESFGLLIPRVLPAKPAKLLKRETTLRQHPWLRLRALFGANWRADIVWLMIQQPEMTPYQVSRRLGCNTETAYRNHRLLKEVDAPALLKLA